jgi:hypothetical protein
VGFLAGAYFGAWAQRLQHDFNEFSAAIGRSFFLSQRADLQYCNADYDAAREALLAWLSHLETVQPVDGKYLDPMMSERTIPIDKVFAFGRLALLEEKAGESSRSREYWQRSEEMAKAASWTDHSEKGIRSILQRANFCGQPTAGKP